MTESKTEEFLIRRPIRMAIITFLIMALIGLGTVFFVPIERRLPLSYCIGLAMAYAAVMAIFLPGLVLATNRLRKIARVCMAIVVLAFVAMWGALQLMQRGILPVPNLGRLILTLEIVFFVLVVAFLSVGISGWVRYFRRRA